MTRDPLYNKGSLVIQRVPCNARIPSSYKRSLVIQGIPCKNGWHLCTKRSLVVSSDSMYNKEWPPFKNISDSDAQKPYS